ncbi:MAG: cupin domain-containing protein [Pseudomonadota bacterium]
MSRFPWTYDSQETSHIIEGRVTVTPDDGTPVEVVAGELAIFPAGMS